MAKMLTASNMTAYTRSKTRVGHHRLSNILAKICAPTFTSLNNRGFNLPACIMCIYYAITFN